MDKLVTWLLFRILLGLVPIGANALRLWTDDLPLDWASLIGRGELLLMCCAVSLGGLGEILGIQGAQYRGGVKLLGFFTVLTVFTAAGYYSVVSSKHAFRSLYVERSVAGAPAQELAQLASFSRYNDKKVADISLALYTFSVLTGVFCIASAEASKSKTSSTDE